MSVNDEWNHFIFQQMKKDGYDPFMNSHLTNDEMSVKINDPPSTKEASIEPKCVGPAPECNELFISTKTKCLYLSVPIDIENIFWKIPILDYYQQECGVVKKQKKIVCNTPEEYEQYKENLSHVNHYYEEQVIKMIDNVGLAPEGTETRILKRRYHYRKPVVAPVAEEESVDIDPESTLNPTPVPVPSIYSKCKKRLQYKNERKITIGMSKKDIVNSRRKKKAGAFYNCFALIVRFQHEDGFHEFHVKIFKTGKLEIPGRFSHSVLKSIKQIILKIVQPYYPDTPIHYVDGKDGVLINSNFNCGYHIDRDKAYSIFRNKYGIETSYNSSSYQGVKCKYYFNCEVGFKRALQTGRILEKDSMKMKELVKTHKYTKIAFMIFRTGSCIIVGNCTKKILYFLYDYIKDILKTEYHELATSYEDPLEKKPVKSAKVQKMNIYVQRVVATGPSS